MKNKTSWIAGIVAVVLLIVGVVVATSEPVKADGIGGLSLNLSSEEIKDLACAIFNKGCPEPVPEPVAEPILGGIPGNVVDGNEFTIGGDRKFYKRIPLQVSGNLSTATTTPCSIQNTTLATTTIERYILDVASSTGVAATFDISTSTTQYASSSPALVFAHAIPASVKRTIVWQPGVTGTTTQSEFIRTRTLGGEGSITGISPFLVGPGEWVNLNVKIAATDTGPNWAGSCSLELSAVR